MAVAARPDAASQLLRAFGEALGALGHMNQTLQILATTLSATPAASPPGLPALQALHLALRDVAGAVESGAQRLESEAALSEALNWIELPSRATLCAPGPPGAPAELLAYIRAFEALLQLSRLGRTPRIAAIRRGTANLHRYATHVLDTVADTAIPAQACAALWAILRALGRSAEGAAALDAVLDRYRETRLAAATRALQRVAKAKGATSDGLVATLRTANQLAEQESGTGAQIAAPAALVAEISLGTLQAAAETLLAATETPAPDRSPRALEAIFADAAAVLRWSASAIAAPGSAVQRLCDRMLAAATNGLRAEIAGLGRVKHYRLGAIAEVTNRAVVLLDRLGRQPPDLVVRIGEHGGIAASVVAVLEPAIRAKALKRARGLVAKREAAAAVAEAAVLANADHLATAIAALHHLGEALGTPAILRWRDRALKRVLDDWDAALEPRPRDRTDGDRGRALVRARRHHLEETLPERFAAHRRVLIARPALAENLREHIRRGLEPRARTWITDCRDAAIRVRRGAEDVLAGIQGIYGGRDDQGMG